MSRIGLAGCACGAAAGLAAALLALGVQQPRVRSAPRQLEACRAASKPACQAVWREVRRRFLEGPVR